MSSTTDFRNDIQKIKELNEKLEIIRKNKDEIYTQYQLNINKLNNEIIPKLKNSFETLDDMSEIEFNEIKELKNENKLNAEKIGVMSSKIKDFEDKLSSLKKNIDKHYVIITNELNSYLEKKQISPCIICQSFVYVPVIPLSECHHNGSCRLKICMTCMRDGILNVKRFENQSEKSLKYKCPICKEENNQRGFKYIINFPYMEVMDHFINKFTEKFYKGFDLVSCDKCDYTTSSILELWKHKKKDLCSIKNRLPYNNILETGQYSFTLTPEPPEIQTIGFMRVSNPTFRDAYGNIHFGEFR